MHGEPTIKGVTEIFNGDVIDIKVDFDQNRIFFMNNEKLVGHVKPKSNLEEDQYFWGVNLSVDTSVCIDNNPMPL